MATVAMLAAERSATTSWLELELVCGISSLVLARKPLDLLGESLQDVFQIGPVGFLSVFLLSCQVQNGPATKLAKATVQMRGMLSCVGFALHGSLDNFPAIG